MTTNAVSLPARRQAIRNGKSGNTVRVAVVGCGYWGPNLMRNFACCPTASLVAAYDQDQQRLRQVLASYASVEPVKRLGSLLDREDIEAVVIATPVSTHAPLALAALEAGKHVLVEKPLARSVREAEALVALAQAKDLVLMVDHTFVYSPPVRRMKQIIDSGDIGEIYYIDGVRINLGLFQHDVNVVWDLAPHDLSILDYLVGRVPRSLSAFGTCHADSRNDIEDVAHLNLDFGDKLMASFHVNWLSPVKVRHFMVGGSKKSIVYNDLEPTEKIKVYDRGIEINHDPERRRGALIDYRTGDVWSPHFEQVEPLQTMVRHFAECIRKGQTPITSGSAGLRVVRMLEAAQHSIKAQGGRITL